MDYDHEYDYIFPEKAVSPAMDVGWIVVVTDQPGVDFGLYF